MTTHRSSFKPEEKAWIFGTLCLITFLVFSSQFTIIIPYFLNDLPLPREDTIWLLIKYLFPFNVGAIGIYWNYYLCVNLDPGGIPKGYKPPKKVLQFIQKQEDQTNFQLRFCKPCKSFKPPRTHHCRTCKKCILRMDHHCPWVANCIGQRNYASFIRFLACVDLTCSMHLILITARVADYWWVKKGGIWRSPSTMVMVMMIMNYALCVPVLLVVGIFSLYHFWNLSVNTTTIEGWEKDKVERMIKRGRIREIDFPFDLGIRKNFVSILGRSPLSWCLPSKTCGDGIHYDVGSEVEDEEQYLWPPKDPQHSTRGRTKPNLGGDPFTYGNGELNPSLHPTNSSQLRQRHRSKVPPWHPDYEGEEGQDENEKDSAQQAGVDGTDGCLPATNNSSAFAFMDGDEYDRRQFEAENGTSDEDDDEEEEEDHRMTKSRVRRGSEGYEVRPKRYDLAYALDAEEEEQRYRDELMNGDNASQTSKTSYERMIGGDVDKDEREIEWKREKEEEEYMRQKLQERWRRELQEGNYNVHSMEEYMREGDKDENDGKPLLPSQVMQKRAQWQQQQQQQQQLVE